MDLQDIFISCIFLVDILKVVDLTKNIVKMTWTLHIPFLTYNFLPYHWTTFLCIMYVDMSVCMYVMYVHGVLPSGRWRNKFFAPGKALLWRIVVGVDCYMEETLFFNGVVIKGLTVYAHPKEDLSLVSIIYSCHMSSHDTPPKFYYFLSTVVF